jgi:DNA (cytosine-5)-methyltransferase 1
MQMTHGSLFSGIGGFDLAAEWMGWENKFHCEWNPFGQRVLKHYWPDSESFTDITKTDFTKYANKIDILSGGFPCQPYSSAGKRLGKEDERHLWPEMLRAIREISPRFVVGENVRGLTNWNGGLVFEEVCAELENYGYQVAPVIIPACGVGAPHRRERIWFVAYSDGNARRRRPCESGREKREANSNGQPEIYTRANSDGQKGDAADAKCSGGIQSSKNLQPQKSNGFEFIRNGRKRNATNTNRNGFNECNGINEINTSKRGEYAFNDIEQIFFDSQRFGRSTLKYDYGHPEKTQQAQCGKQQFSGADSAQDWWRNFPSKSPVCGGDDGISIELDGITFPKWRAESIKGYGNAIVPQVAYQIFKALELCK